MNRIVRENYPVAELPEDLRKGLSQSDVATITIEVGDEKAAPAPTLAELLTLRRPPWLTPEQIQAQIDEVREDRDL